MRILNSNIISTQNKRANFKGTFVVDDQRVIKNSENYKEFLTDKFNRVVGTFDKQANNENVVLKSLSENDTLVFLQLKQLGLKFKANINQ